MTYLRQKRCGKRASSSFLIQLVGVSGWKGTLLLGVGTLASILSGFILVYRVTFMVPFFNAYFAWVQSTELDSSNLTANSKSLRHTYAGLEYTTFDGFVELSTYSVNVYFILGAVTVVSTFTQILLLEYVNTANVEKLRHMFFTQALRQDMTWHEQLKKENDLNSRLSVDLERVRNNLGSKTSQLILSSASILTSLYLIFTTNWIMGVVALIGIAITCAFTLISGKQLAKQVKKEQENDRIIGNAATEVLTTFKIVKSFCRESYEDDKFTKLLKTGREYSKIKHIICSIHSAYNICSAYSLVTAFFCIGTWLINDRAISPGEYCTGYYFLLLSSLSSGNLVPVISDVVEAAASFSNLLSLKEVVPEIDPLLEGGLRAVHLKSDIYFKDVTFAYPRRKNFKVLNNLTIKIPQGKCVALVGPSGSGKSTVIDLLLRLRDPDSGKITIGDVNIKTINVEDLRQRIGIVMLEPVLFDTTIEENIRYGNVAATFADIQEAAKLANAHDFIVKLPDGYQTIVGERGGNLSGGQKQRVAIARALVRDPDILLLDEATSALDSHSEAVVQEAIERVMKGRTTIVVAHRLSTISKADYIYVLKDGFVHECGTHSELRRGLGVYHSMQSQQNLQKVAPGAEINNMISPTSDQSSIIRDSGTSAKPDLKGNGTDDHADEAKSISMKYILKTFLHWKQSVSLIFSMIGASHCSCFCLIYFYHMLQCFKESFHAGTADLYSNGLNMIYFDVVLGIVFFIAILSASIAMEDSVEKLRSGMFRKVLKRDMCSFDRDKSKVTQLANDIIQKPGQLKNFAGSKASGAVTGVIQILAALVASFIGFWQLTLIQCLFFIFAFVVNFVQVKLKLKLQRSAGARLKEGSKLASECFDNIKTVHCLSIEKEIADNYKSIFIATKEELVDNVSYAITYALVSCISFFCQAASMALVLKPLRGYLSSSSIDFMLASTYNFQVSFTSLAVLIIYFQDFGQSKQSVLDSLVLVHDDCSENPEPSETTVLKGGIEFVDVHFSYPSSQKCPVLRGFSLKVHPGQTVALVGSSGHGKSTIVNLIEKFYLADKGKIVIDGVDIRDIYTHYLRDNMALVTQEPLLFNMTIRENILYGAKSGSQISENTLIMCCKQANIYDFIMGLPERFETIVGARGSQLSGGQRQRIAIARALIRDPKILLLDEATSALDSESEKEVLDALDRVVQGRTTIVIAHRLTTIRSADLIAVVENGRVKEQGNHEELLKLKGSYCEMLQMK